MRRSDREVTDLSEIRDILDSGKVLRLGLCDGDRPYVVPMNYAYAFEGPKLVFYVHCAREGRKLDVIRSNPNCCVETDCALGLIESQAPCHYGYAFCSLIGFGKASPVEDVAAKAEAMSLFMEQQTGKHFDFGAEMVSSVVVLRIECESYAAKRRAMPGK